MNIFLWFCILCGLLSKKSPEKVCLIRLVLGLKFTFLYAYRASSYFCHKKLQAFGMTAFIDHWNAIKCWSNERICYIDKENGHHNNNVEVTMCFSFKQIKKKVQPLIYYCISENATQPFCLQNLKTAWPPMSHMNLKYLDQSSTSCIIGSGYHTWLIRQLQDK